MKYQNEGVWKTTGRPREKENSIPAAKLLRCLQMINLLKNGRYSVHEIASKFDINTRTAYRYINLFEEVGLLIEQDFNKKFFIIEHDYKS